MTFAGVPVGKVDEMNLWEKDPQFVQVRHSVHADAEIRRLAIRMLDILKMESTHVFSDMEVVFVDGIETIHAEYRKV